MSGASGSVLADWTEEHRHVRMDPEMGLGVEATAKG